MLPTFLAKELYDISFDEFKKAYESTAYQEFMDYVECRMRMEIISIIRYFDLKGDVFFELRKKSALSAYNKIQKEMAAHIVEFGDRRLSFHDIIQDIVGCRIICTDESVVESVVRLILQVENIEIKEDGIELYDAHFRAYTDTEPRRASLGQIFSGIGNDYTASGDNREASPMRRLSKKSLYESLHFYVHFSSPFDQFQLSPANSRLMSATDESTRRRDIAEWEYVGQLWTRLGEDYRVLSREFPVEFQIRTTTEHMWASEEHRFVYSQLKQGLTTISSEDLEVLRSAFVGLKYAYLHIDQLRSMVRRIAFKSTNVEAVYTGRSKDLNDLRFFYFGNRREEIAKLFGEADSLFTAIIRRSPEAASSLVERLTPLLDRLVKLHERLQDVEGASTKQAEGAAKLFPEETFSAVRWGRNRVFLLFIAYVMLFSGVGALDKKLRWYLDKLEVSKVIGLQSLGLAEQRSDGGVFLASRIYERVRAFDEFALIWLTEVADGPEGAASNEATHNANLFRDPLVGVRHASSLFLQEQFAGARQSLDRVFRLSPDGTAGSWNNLPLAVDFSQAELQMRYTQYIWFEYFQDIGELLDKFQILENGFNAIFSLPSDGYNYSIYRAYSWYYAVFSYLQTRRPFLPDSFLNYQERCLAYLRTHYEEAHNGGDTSAGNKIEVLLSLIPLSGTQGIYGTQTERLDRFRRVLKGYRSYPARALRIIDMMATEIANTSKMRAISSSYTFISYVHEDRPLVEEVAQELVRAGIPTRYDQEFRAGSSLLSSVENILDGAYAAIIVVSKAYLAAEGWAKEERAYLMEQRRKSKIKLYIVLSGIAKKELLTKAPLLADILWIDLGEDKPAAIARLISDILKDRKDRDEDEK